MSDRQHRRIRVEGEGAIPNAIAILDSEIHHVYEQLTQDASRALLQDERVRKMEITVGHIDKVVTWGFGILAALIIALLTTVLARK